MSLYRRPSTNCSPARGTRRCRSSRSPERRRSARLPSTAGGRPRPRWSSPSSFTTKQSRLPSIRGRWPATSESLPSTSSTCWRLRRPVRPFPACSPICSVTRCSQRDSRRRSSTPNAVSWRRCSNGPSHEASSSPGQTPQMFTPSCWVPPSPGSSWWPTSHRPTWPAASQRRSSPPSRRDKRRAHPPRAVHARLPLPRAPPPVDRR